jgi:hypothetical protein
MKSFVEILPSPPEIVNRLKLVVIAESVQGLTRYVELKKVITLRKVKNRRLFKVRNTGRARGDFPVRDELSADPQEAIVGFPQVKVY